MAELEKLQQVAAEEIMSYVESTPVLTQSSHNEKIEEHEQWRQILGTGYNNVQRRCMIYRHLDKLLSTLREITKGDATKAKDLSDLLFCRMHAGENVRRMDKVSKVMEHKRSVAQAIVGSLSDFVYALHDAAGKGRCPPKIQHAKQVGNAKHMIHEGVLAPCTSHVVPCARIGPCNSCQSSRKVLKSIRQGDW